MLEVTRGQVDNENNNQSQYSNMSNEKSYVWSQRAWAIRMGISEVWDRTQQGNEYRNEKHRNAMSEQEQEVRTIL